MFQGKRLLTAQEGQHIIYSETDRQVDRQATEKWSQCASLLMQATQKKTAKRIKTVKRIKLGIPTVKLEKYKKMGHVSWPATLLQLSLGF